MWLIKYIMFLKRLTIILLGQCGGFWIHEYYAAICVL